MTTSLAADDHHRQSTTFLEFYQPVHKWHVQLDMHMIDMLCSPYMHRCLRAEIATPSGSLLSGATGAAGGPAGLLEAFPAALRCALCTKLRRVLRKLARYART